MILDERRTPRAYTEPACPLSRQVVWYDDVATRAWEQNLLHELELNPTVSLESGWIG
jgi:hypothetical protein